MNDSKKPLFAIVLLHGLAAPQDELAFMATNIHHIFGATVLIIQPHCRARHRSVCLSTNKQAEKVLWYIQSKFRQYQVDKSLPLVLIGYSHGGVLAVILGKRYRDNLNIKGIVTINAPLNGVALLSHSPKEIKTFMSEAKEILQLVGYRPSWLYQTVIASGIVPWLLPRLHPSLHTILPLYGLKDLHPESTCIETVGHFLQKGAYGIPILMMATYQDDLRKLFDIKEQRYVAQMIQFNHRYANYITGNPLSKHDTLISLSSQLGNGCHIYPTHIKSKIYKELIHAHNLIAINPSLFVRYGERVIYAKQILTDLITFIQAYTSMG